MKLGSYTLKSKLILSPLEGVSDLGFRSLCYRNGAGLTWTEMIRADGVGRKNKATLALIDSYDPDTPTGIQLVTNSYKDLKKALKTLEKLALESNPEELTNSLTDNNNTTPILTSIGTSPATLPKINYSHFNNLLGVDINFGCPSLEIINIGAGPALMKRKQQLSDIFLYLNEFKNTTTLKNISFVGCKIRLGLNEYEKNNKIYENLLNLSINNNTNENLLDYITIHGRHGKQKSSQLSDWNKLKEIKETFHHHNIKLIANGDLKSIYDLENFQNIIEYDGYMIARGAIYNPWCFQLLKLYLELREQYNKDKNINTNLIQNFPSNILISNINDINNNNNELNLLNYNNINYQQGTYCINSFPKLKDIQQSIIDYDNITKKYNTKDKYIKFNKLNLTKIYNGIKNNNINNIKYSGPNSLNSI